LARLTYQPDHAATRSSKPVAIDIGGAGLPQELWPRAMVLVTWGFALVLIAILPQMVLLLTAMSLGSAAVAVAAVFGPCDYSPRQYHARIERHPLHIALIPAVLLLVAPVVLAL
jgi:hypothetical protein